MSKLKDFFSNGNFSAPVPVLSGVAIWIRPLCPRVLVHVNNLTESETLKTKDSRASLSVEYTELVYLQNTEQFTGQTRRLFLTKLVPKCINT